MNNDTSNKVSVRIGSHVAFSESGRYVYADVRAGNKKAPTLARATALKTISTDNVPLRFISFNRSAARIFAKQSNRQRPQTTVRVLRFSRSETAFIENNISFLPGTGRVVDPSQTGSICLTTAYVRRAFGSVMVLSLHHERKSGSVAFPCHLDSAPRAGM
jgi:hypothetical protein